ncbi:putative glucan endo-1,3-beta-glucosidase [Fusarium oxysporum f. sp. raphani]|uniref:Putative glucan endo-1,3-beta-glucosidase n=1 Tax=Fusarium oxysporum f. sp. raphani TaxID=96318 RepID=A0A8J5PQX1_FUSOX|nr:putative glucan endo-1,3-beta-glucosidase [Fusarium oxysporum f. sp. raphani]
MRLLKRSWSKVEIPSSRRVGLRELQSYGVADDTDAINKAISSGGRCGGGKCTGSTIYPATVYFPPAPSFVGLGVITSKNNFLRSIRNFIIDVRPTPAKAQVCGIHWQFTQGTSLENLHFYMTKPKDVPSKVGNLSTSIY